MQEVKTLKLNVNNIKSTLIQRNKNLKKIKVQEKSFLLKQKQEKLRIEKEKFTESKIKGSGGLGDKAKKVMAPAMSFIDKIKEFLGLLLLGIAVNSLPTLIKKVQDFLDDNKWIIDTVQFLITATGNALLGVIDILDFMTPGKQEQLIKEREELSNKIGELVGVTNESEKELDESIKEAAGQDTTRSREEVREDVLVAIQTEGITREDFESFIKDYTKARETNQRTSVMKVPGVGTYQRKSGFLGLGLAEETKDTFGRDFSSDNFNRRIENVKSDFEAGTFDSAFKEYSRGGIASNNKSSGEAKVARREAVQLLNLNDSVLKTSKVLEKQGENNDEFKKLTNNFRTFLDLTKEDEPDIRSAEYNRRRQEQAKLSFGISSDLKSTKGISLGEDDIVGRVGNTGRSTGSHIHIETGDGYGNTAGGYIPSAVMDSIIVDGKPLSSFQMGDGLDAGRNHKGFDYPIREGAPITLKSNLKFLEYDEGYNKGYGNALVIVDSNGKKYLLGHLDSGPSRSTKQKIDNLKAKAGGGNNIPPNQVTPVSGSGIQLQPLTPYQKSLYTGNKDGGGGPMRHDQLTQTFDGEGMTDIIIINNTQPIIIPGPTRYIRR